MRVAVQRSAGINARVFEWKAVGMSDLVWLTLVRYPPRVLSEGMGNRGMRVAVWRFAAWVLALVWFPAGFHVASAVAAGEMRWPADVDSWLMLAVLAPAGLPLATACGGLWRRGHGVAAWAAVVVLVPAIVGGGVAADPVRAGGGRGVRGRGQPAGVAPLRLSSSLPAGAAARLPPPCRVRPERAHRLFADHPIAVAVAHVRIGRVSARHRRNAVAPGLLASDSSVAVVVPQAQCIGGGIGRGARGCGRGAGIADAHDHHGRGATR